jgi:hypothetical protein
MIERRTVITVLTAPLVEGYGGQMTRDWDHATARTTVAHAQPYAFRGSATELTDRRETLVIPYALDLPAGDPIEATDRVEFDGRTWEVEGEPGRWTLQGVPHHVEVLVHRVSEPTA